MDPSGRENDSTKIRKIEVSHIGDLIHIGDAVNLSPWTADSYIAELKNPDSIMLRLVADGNKTIGFIVGRVIGTHTETREAEIYNLAVKEADQRKGNGQRLFEAFADECRKAGVTAIWLEVRESNEKAIAFYQRNGFLQVQKRGNFYDNPREHALLMRLTLEKYLS